MNRAAPFFAAIALCCSFIAPAFAQPTVKEQRAQAAQDALKKAVDEANAAGKVLLVTFSPDAGKAKENAAALGAPATKAWIARHALVNELTNADAIRVLTEAGLKQRAGGDPLLFVDGISEPLLFPRAGAVKNGTTTADGSIALAMRLDWTVRSPVLAGEFMNRHEAGLPSLAHPFSAAPGDDFIARLNAARALAREEKWEPAAKDYATLFAVKPSEYDGVRLGIVAAEMSVLATKSPKAKDAFLALRRTYAGAMDPRDHRQLFEYLILCRVVGDHEHNLKFLDETLSAKSSVVVLPKPDLLTLEWLLPKCHFDDTTREVPNPSKWPAQLMAKAGELEKSKNAGEVTRAVEFARWMAPMEMARRLGWLSRTSGGGGDAKIAVIRGAVKAWPDAASAEKALDAASAANHVK